MDEDRIIRIVPQVVGLLVVLSVGFFVFSEIMDVLQLESNTTGNSIFDNNDYDDKFHEQMNINSPLKRELPKPVEPVEYLDTYETEEIDYDDLLNDIGKGFMDVYDVNDTYEYDESLGDLLGGI